MWLLLSNNNSVNVEMPLLQLLLLVLPLSNLVSSEQSGLKENDLGRMMNKIEKLNGIEDRFEEVMQRMEGMDISWKTEKADLEKKLETKNEEVENLQTQLKGILTTQKKNHQEVASLKSEMTVQMQKVQEKNQSLKSEVENHCQAEVKKELEKVLPMAVEQGLRDLPFEMVCAYKGSTGTASNSIVNYDRISVEFNNADRPGGADGSMNIETGVFTTVTSGFYIVTYSAIVQVLAGDYTKMYLYHNGVQLEESLFHTSMLVGSGGEYIEDQGSRTVVNIVFNC